MQSSTSWVNSGQKLSPQHFHFFGKYYHARSCFCLALHDYEVTGLYLDPNSFLLRTPWKHTQEWKTCRNYRPKSPFLTWITLLSSGHWGRENLARVRESSLSISRHLNLICAACLLYYTPPDADETARAVSSRGTDESHEPPGLLQHLDAERCMQFSI